MSVQVSARAPGIDATNPATDVGRRLLDLVLGTITLVLAAPFIIAIAIAIRIDSPGPAVFRQVRVGRGGREFRFYKFRTMKVNARELYPELYRYRYDEQQIQSMCFKYIHDPRLTRVGAVLRRISLDELPNLWNVLRGDITLVGPRPEIPEMLPYYTNEQLRKFSVKPGVTGLAQVRGRGLLTFQDTIQQDLAYVDSRSWKLDLKILAATVLEVVRLRGAF
jgi:lipopolysaccharide/colanic/teichoic acid biosynthesis glycosyltransferase